MLCRNGNYIIKTITWLTTKNHIIIMTYHKGKGTTATKISFSNGFNEASAQGLWQAASSVGSHQWPWFTVQFRLQLSPLLLMSNQNTAWSNQILSHESCTILYHGHDEGHKYLFELLLSIYIFQFMKVDCRNESNTPTNIPR